ncbi:YrvL family regulatory protein [Oceanobacillus sojae]|uniref:YrvL family regulatory protein n=1 Tax=Oceanobacillus sojae TaxID=582851 RepID=UPI0009884C15|nr:YrvL family regulatory protein [Oceanobacillus sojae]MCT1905459.1 regulatory YrvL family protein [Oceanobacillus sojae]
MSENENDSFRDKNVKEKIIVIIGITLLIVLAVGFVFGLFFFGMAGVFKLLGVQYDSIWSLVIFVICMFGVGLILEVVTKSIFVLSTRNMTEKTKILLIRIIIEFTSNWLVLFTVDELMNSITLSVQTEVVIAALLTAIEIIFDDDDKEDEETINETRN